MDKNRKILSTRPLSNELLAAVTKKGVQITVLPFIDTMPVLTTLVAEEIEQAAMMQACVVFTSMNAVEAVTTVLDGQRPAWHIYCMGNTTRQLVEEYFGALHIAGTANDAASLAEKIIDAGVMEDVYFFCGNQRRDELPEMLRQADIEVQEIVVYETIETPHKLQEEFAAILFYSPSAVHSFFRNNTIPENTLLFAIGNTTASAIRKFNTLNKLIIADEPGKEQLVWQAVEKVREL